MRSLIITHRRLNGLQRTPVKEKIIYSFTLGEEIKV